MGKTTSAMKHIKQQKRTTINDNNNDSHFNYSTNTTNLL